MQSVIAAPRAEADEIQKQRRQEKKRGMVLDLLTYARDISAQVAAGTRYEDLTKCL